MILIDRTEKKKKKKKKRRKEDDRRKQINYLKTNKTTSSRLSPSSFLLENKIVEKINK